MEPNHPTIDRLADINDLPTRTELRAAVKHTRATIAHLAAAAERLHSIGGGDRTEQFEQDLRNACDELNTGLARIDAQMARWGRGRK